MLQIFLPGQVRVLHRVSLLVCLEICWRLFAGQVNGLLDIVFARLGVYLGSFS